MIYNYCIMPIRRNGKLTPKETKFVKVIAEQIRDTGTYNASQAALAAYDTKPSTAGNLGSENLSKPPIQEAVQKALEKNGLSLDSITGNIGKIAVSEPEKISAEAVLRANEMILKLHGAFPGSKHTNLNVSVKGKMKDLTFQAAKLELEKLNAQLGELIEEPQAPDVA